MLKAVEDKEMKDLLEQESIDLSKAIPAIEKQIKLKYFTYLIYTYRSDF